MWAVLDGLDVLVCHAEAIHDFFWQEGLWLSAAHFRCRLTGLLLIDESGSHHFKGRLQGLSATRLLN